jgi:hypothetical protein
MPATGSRKPRTARPSARDVVAPSRRWIGALDDHGRSVEGLQAARSLSFSHGDD